MSETGMVGRDFSALDGRMEADEPPWDFEGLCLAAMTTARDVLDLGIGDGERLIALIGRLDAAGTPRPRMVATEGWEPNVPVAGEALRPYGVEVLGHDPDAGERLALPDASFDLVMTRREALDPHEVARVLRPGGVLLAQQVDGHELPELWERFGGEPACPDVTLARFRALVAQAGLAVTEAQEWAGSYRFADATALADYLRLVPWDRPAGFDAAALPPGPITLTQLRFWLRAERPRI